MNKKQLTLQDYLRPFTPLLLKPVREWQKEADTNKAFYMGKKEFVFVKTMTGDWPVNDEKEEQQ